MMNLLAASPLLLALWGCRPVRPLTALDRESLSLERCLPLRGLMALVVLIHHLAQNTDSGALLRVYLNVGALPVSVFFFLSGYGLMRGAMTRSAYGRGFILRHVPPPAGFGLLYHKAPRVSTSFCKKKCPVCEQFALRSPSEVHRGPPTISAFPL